MKFEELVRKFFVEELITELSSIPYDTHHRERCLIKDLASISVDPVHLDGATIDLKTENLDRSPQIDYTLPTGRNVRKEIGDVLFDAVAEFPGDENRRRTFITQAKFDSAGTEWDVDQEQFFFIHNLPVFVLQSPNTCRSFNFEDMYTGDRDHDYTGGTFTTGLFGSHSVPFVLSTDRILEGLDGIKDPTDIDYEKPSDETFRRSRRRWAAFDDNLIPVLYRFLNAGFGTIVRERSEMERFVDHIEEISTLDDYSSIRNPTLCTDGGQREDVERPGFVYIKFRIDMGDADDYQWSDVL